MTGDGQPATPLAPGAIPPGTNVLVAGPAMTGKRRLLFDVVAASPDRSAVLVTSKTDAGRFRHRFLEDRPDAEAWSATTVDCVSRLQAIGPVRDSATVRHVTSPGDLTGIGIAASGLLRECYHADSTTHLGLHSLSTLLMYADLHRVYQFLHVLTGRTAACGFTGAYTLDTTARDTESLEVLLQLFDAVVHVREGDDDPELRVRGGEFGPGDWTPF